MSVIHVEHDKHVEPSLCDIMKKFPTHVSGPQMSFLLVRRSIASRLSASSSRFFAEAAPVVSKAPPPAVEIKENREAIKVDKVEPKTAVDEPKKEAKKEEAKKEEPKAVLPKPVSTVWQRLSAFTAGVTLTALLYSLALHQDVLQASVDTRRHLDGLFYFRLHFYSRVLDCWSHTALHSDLIVQDSDLKSRVKALEKLVAEMQAKK